MLEVNKKNWETQLLSTLEPLGLRLSLLHSNAADRVVDAVMTLPDGEELPAELKMKDRWEFFPSEPGDRIVIQPYINPRLAERYRQRGVFYMDLVGNAWIWTDPVKIFIEGRARPREAYSEPLDGRLSTPSALRLIFILLNEPSAADLTLRRQAAMAGISLGTTQRTIRALRDLRFLTDSTRTLRRRDELTNLWLSGFTSRLIPKLQARTVEGATPLEVLAEITRSQLDFTPAGEAVSPTMSSRSSVTIYGPPPWTELIRAARLRPAPDGSITLRERFWDPESMDLTQFGHTLLICGEMLASPDERIREAGMELKEDLQ
ncbi:type IV toxin-antitoxin system AbiEi family antitoxin [Corynebacterium freneyi]|uniref:type IV toxin-antitoxin system AbiEi family antitoxin n=1 Tax=Corynebacterium freneyi TaxID=134034 RepID=UPI00396C990D